MRKQYIIPVVEILPYRTDDLCAGGGESDLNPTSLNPPEGGGFGSSPARKLYI